MPAEMQRRQLVAMWTLSSFHHHFQNVFSQYWVSVNNTNDASEKYEGAHNNNISYHIELKDKNEMKRENETKPQLMVYIFPQNFRNLTWFLKLLNFLSTWE